MPGRQNLLYLKFRIILVPGKLWKIYQMFKWVRKETTIYVLNSRKYKRKCFALCSLIAVKKSNKQIKCLEMSRYCKRVEVLRFDFRFYILFCVLDFKLQN